MRDTHPQRTISGISNSQPIAGSDGGFALAVGEVTLTREQREHPIVREVGSIFNVSGFERPVTPILVGQAGLDGVPAGTRVSSLAIKFPGTDYRVPNEMAGLAETLARAAAFEHAINPHVSDYYAYLTIQQTVVEAGEVQRGSAIHSDGIQGPRIQPKQPIERGYLIVDRFPPLFYPHPFDMTGVSADRHRLDVLFSLQARRDEAITAPANTIVCFDSYCVHQAVPATDPGPRTFLRLTYSTRQYDRFGNTQNALFHAHYARHGWVFRPRPMPFYLIDPPGQGRRLR